MFCSTCKVVKGEYKLKHQSRGWFFLLLYLYRSLCIYIPHLNKSKCLTYHHIYCFCVKRLVLFPLQGAVATLRMIKAELLKVEYTEVAHKCVTKFVTLFLSPELPLNWREDITTLQQPCPVYRALTNKNN